MTTPVQHLRQLITLLESVEESVESEITDPATIQAANRLAKLVNTLEEQQLMELNWRKMIAAGALSVSALAPGLANAGGLIDTTNNGTMVMGCAAVLNVASGYPGYDSHTREQVKSYAQMFTDVGRAYIKKAKDSGDESLAQELNDQYKNSAAKALNSDWKPVLNAAYACARGAQAISNK